MSTEQIPGSFPVLTREELEVSARNAITRFLGNPSGQAHDMARELTDEELTTIADAATQRDTARQAIKDVFAAAYERKRKAHEAAAQADLERLSKRSKVLRVLASVGAPPEVAQNTLLVLSDGERTILAELDGEHDIDEVVKAVVERARNRKEDKVTVSLTDGTLEPAYDKADEQAHEDAAGETEQAADATAKQPASDETAEAPATEAPAPPDEPAAEPVADSPTPTAPAAETPKPVKKPAKK